MSFVGWVGSSAEKRSKCCQCVFMVLVETPGTDLSLSSHVQGRRVLYYTLWRREAAVVEKGGYLVYCLFVLVCIRFNGFLSSFLLLGVPLASWGRFGRSAITLSLVL
jgi:hypothetical protein